MILIDRNPVYHALKAKYDELIKFSNDTDRSSISKPYPEILPEGPHYGGACSVDPNFNNWVAIAMSFIDVMERTEVKVEGTTTALTQTAVDLKARLFSSFIYKDDAGVLAPIPAIAPIILATASTLADQSLVDFSFKAAAHCRTTAEYHDDDRGLIIRPKSEEVIKVLKSSVVILTCKPYSGYEFVKWSDNSTQNPYHLTVNSNTTNITPTVQLIPTP